MCSLGFHPQACTESFREVLRMVPTCTEHMIAAGAAGRVCSGTTSCWRAGGKGVYAAVDARPVKDSAEADLALKVKGCGKPTCCDHGFSFMVLCGTQALRAAIQHPDGGRARWVCAGGRARAGGQRGGRAGATRAAGGAPGRLADRQDARVPTRRAARAAGGRAWPPPHPLRHHHPGAHVPSMFLRLYVQSPMLCTRHMSLISKPYTNTSQTPKQ